MSSYVFLGVHGLCMMLTGMVLTSAVTALALISRQGQKLFFLLLLTVVPSTILCLMLPLVTQLLPIRPAVTSLLQGVLTGPLICLPLLLRLKNIPPSWHTTAQELGLGKTERCRFIWLPLLISPLLASFFLSFLLSCLGTLTLLKTY